MTNCLILCSRKVGEVGMKLGWEIALRATIYIVTYATSIFLCRKERKRINESAKNRGKDDA